jgi:hypothetical protein
MNSPRLAFLALGGLCLALSFPASGQSVIATHSGVVYFFEGSVFLGQQRLEQSFGRFPDIGDGGELRTEHGRAEVLLTPGSFLRIGDNSAIRMLSTSLSDTRIELLSGSAILESREAADSPARLVYQGWRVQIPQAGIYRIDSDPARVTVNKGEVEVLAEGNKEPVTVKEGETLPLQAVLVTETADPAKTDDFEKWAMGRSQAIYADNATAAEIFDDPAMVDPSGLVMGGFSRFPITGIPSLGLGSPYGLSFWSPFQPSLNALYIPVYQYAPLYLGYGYPGYYPGVAGGLRGILPGSGIGTGIGTRYPYGGISPSPLGTRYPYGGISPSPLGGRYPSYGIGTPRVPSGTIHTPPAVAPPHIGARPVGHR